ncbi:hypothetical protein ETU08_06165 [Apibacter muscae]|uniref:Uncharacterized protein n=1 Tax=Apibacter muscae TaxID=2509004 RepID=A0A563DI12_9FLAO|nr:hypothetical protein [Apibacter muscae]TWP24298.1 hypothetical protein ETU10_03380 [Apibacter muscae]TWP29454.1 hypothetical protein ETU09_03140 [Apibacter muscae]TWP30140.1 hypothetical protein ETU08_06165 [Apibacter muscae]
MKSFRTIIFLVLFLNFTILFAQKDSLNLTLEYLPNKNYTFNSDIQMIIEGWENNTINYTNQIKNLYSKIISTGNLNNNKFPFSIRFNDENNIDLNKYEFKGICSPLEYPKISYVVPTIENKDIENFYLNYIQEAIKEIPILTKKLKLGESFTTSSPLKYTLSEFLSLDLLVLKHYTLVKIDSNYAYFDYEMKASIKNFEYMDIKYSGKSSGKGKLVYDINNHFFISSKNNESILNLNMLHQGKTSLLKIKTFINEDILIHEN